MVHVLLLLILYLEDAYFRNIMDLESIVHFYMLVTWLCLDVGGISSFSWGQTVNSSAEFDNMFP